MPGYSVFKPDFATGGTAAAAGIGSIAGLPWNIVLPIALSFITSFLDGDSEEDEFLRLMNAKKNMQALGMRQPYRSPNLPAIDRITMQAILNRLKRSGNWGWPGGKEMDLSFLDDYLGGGSLSLTGSRMRR